MSSVTTPIPDVDKLSEMIKKNGLTPQAIDSFPQEYAISFADSDLQTIMNFAVSFDRKILFYQYLYLSKEEYIVENIEANKYGETQPKAIQKYLTEHNQKINNIDFSIPFALNVFCLYEGHSIGVTIVNSEMEEIAMHPSEEIMDNLSELARESYAEEEHEKHKVRKKLSDELSNIILNDPGFGKMTNAMLRERYLDALLEKPENAKYADAFMVGISGRIYGRKDFLTLVWSDYRKLHKPE